MNTGPTQALIEKYIDAWNRHDVEAVLRHFADDCYYEDKAFWAINRGKNELRAFCEHSFASMSKMHFTIRGTFIQGDGVGWEWTVAGYKAKGDALGILGEGDALGVVTKDVFVTAEGASITRFRDGLIVHNVDYYDSRSFLNQLDV